MKDVRIVTWNTNRRNASILNAFAERGKDADIVTLQEVTLERSDAFRGRLAEMGLVNAIYTGILEVPEKLYGNVIASCWPLAAIPIDEAVRRKLAWPKLLGLPQLMQADANCTS